MGWEQTDGTITFEVSNRAGTADSQDPLAAVATPGPRCPRGIALAEEGRDLAKTTVITTLNTMVDKKYLQRTLQGNTYLFVPRITETEVAQRVLGDVVDRVFDGSTAALLLKLFDVKKIDEEELKDLRRIINRRLRGRATACPRERAPWRTH
jgi:BlaI family transcriptional regulator, penicillinase repressor